MGDVGEEVCEVEVEAEAEESSNVALFADRGTSSDAFERDLFNGRGIRLRTEDRNEGDRPRFKRGGSC